MDKKTLENIALANATIGLVLFAINTLCEIGIVVDPNIAKLTIEEVLIRNAVLNGIALIFFVQGAIFKVLSWFS